MTKTALYRHFDAAGQLLYVGISLCAFQRTRQHGNRAPWFEDVARIDIEWFGSRAEAEGAEWQAIKREHPRYNRAFNQRSQAAQHDVGPMDLPMMVVGDTFVSKATLIRIAGNA